LTNVHYNLVEIKQKIAPQVALVIQDVVGAIKTEIEASAAGTKSGRVYKRKGRSHRASAKGEAPAIDSRALIDSIEVPPSSSPFKGELRITAPHAEILEGDESHPGTRPFVRLAIAKVEREFNGR
jgi:hypothetical protein